MLQEYPTQIQPRSSSTRETQDVIELQDSANTLDAEASRILIDLANQDTSSLQYMLGTSNMMIDNNNNKKRSASKGDIKVSLPIKTDANLHLQQERSQPDPIMLLAAAAAVIDDEGKYKKRSYERREIRLLSRHAAKRKSFTYGQTSHHQDNSLLHRRHSERRHRFQRSSVSMANDTWTTSFPTSKEEEEEQVERVGKGNESQPTEGSTHAFSWQYLSMKQNPRIKRNAMHAYITYMIYTDMAHEQQQQRQQQRPPPPPLPPVPTSSQPSSSLENEWYSTKTTMQTYRLPPSPRQPPTQDTTIIGRPLTDFLFDNKTKFI